MVQKFDGYNWLVRLEKGEKVVECLIKFAHEQSLSAAHIFGIGSASWVEIGFYDPKKKEYEWHKYDKTLEIANLQGNIAWYENEPAVHLHGNFSDREMKIYSGHVRELEVGSTTELFIHNWFGSQPLKRFDDPGTGLKLLDL